MVKKVVAKTANISMDGFKARPVFDGQTPAGAAAGERPPAGQERGRDRPYTGVGSVMSAITREAEVMQELVQVQEQLTGARQQLEQVKDAVLVSALDPHTVRRSRWANRSEAEFATPEFRALRAEIEHAGGNVQPIKVRVLTPAAAGASPSAPSPLYEIVYGHRRHQACLELGLPVAAIVAQSMSDQDLFAAMDRENRGRKNLSAWEQGRMYNDALKAGLYASLRRLSESLGVNLSDASRTVQLAKLPAEVVAAFASPLDLQVRWAKPLVDALQKDPDSVLRRARSLSKSRGALTAAQVFDELTGAAAPALPTTTPVILGQTRMASISMNRHGRALVEFEPGALPPERHQALATLIEAFLSRPV